jgi:GT2 family glycosyltransferase
VLVLHSLPRPAIGLCTDVSLYLKLHGGARYSFSESAAALNAGDAVSTDTYFGVVPAGKWFRHSGVRTIVIDVDVEGAVDVEVVQARAHHAPRTIAATVVNGNAAVSVWLPPLEDIGDGHLFLRVRAIEDDVRFRTARVWTPDPPRRPVRLVLSMTTYNREDYVRSNVARLDHFLAERPDVAESVRMVVVDNGRNLKLPETHTLEHEVVPNPNLGGAGGFARGLLAARDGGWATHVLFMDDDISFEPEIVGRIIGVLSFAEDSQLCIAGAMLREEQPHLQFEAGAVIHTRSTVVWHPQGQDRDLRESEELLSNEADEPIDYGGWWCFAFPLTITNELPLPIFVRGDDACFGLRHCGGHLVTINGIGVWHQDFSFKNGPVAFYYEARNIPVVLTVSRPDYDAAAFRRRMIERTLRFAAAFKYDTARAFLDGVESYLDGPAALLATPADQFHDQLRERYGETLTPLPPEKRTLPEWRPPREPLPVLWRLAALTTLGGHLLPRQIRGRRSWAVRAESTPAMAMVGADELVFRHDPSGSGFVARRDQRRFREILRRMARINRRVSCEFDAAATQWREAYSTLVSEESWRRQLAPPTDGPEPR